ncbi:MAG: radical SAM protein [Gemmatimonadota bacterium]|nr:radical SAM protein [Gemmatimonadota bacterium]
MIAQTDLFNARSSPNTQPSSRILATRKRGATFVAHKIKSVINPPESTGMGFWSLNPYVGCEFGCTYCYARYAHRYTVERTGQKGGLPNSKADGSTWNAFERQIFVKQRDAVLEALERDLPKIVKRRSRLHQPTIVIGTATDSYQPAERSFEITRTVLERLKEERDLAIGFITKSPLITRDIDLLLELQQKNRVSIYISLISTDPEIIRRFEARSPMPHVRIRTLHDLIAAGLNAGCIVAPILPQITDTVPQIRALAEAVKDAGGRFAHPTPLRLYPAIHSGFLPVIERYYPDLYPKYRRVYRGAGIVSASYTEALVRRFRRIAASFDIPVRDPVLDSSTFRYNSRTTPTCNKNTSKQIQLELQQ